MLITSAFEGSTREYKSLRHVAMVAKFLDDNKPKTSLKTFSDSFINLVQFQLICQMLATFSGVKSERTVCKIRKRKKNCVVFTQFMRPTRETRKFHVVVVLCWLRNVQKSMTHVQSCYFTILNLFLFCRSRCRRRRRCLSSLLL